MLLSASLGSQLAPGTLSLLGPALVNVCKRAHMCSPTLPLGSSDSPHRFRVPPATSSSVSSLSSCCSRSPLYSLKGQVYAWQKARVLVRSDCCDETSHVRDLDCRSLSSRGQEPAHGSPLPDLDSTLLSVLMSQRARPALFWGDTNRGPAPTPSSHIHHLLSLVSEYHPASSQDSTIPQQ